MQGKLAAQKLAEKLDIKMACFEPEGGTVANYREVKDEEGWSSAEDWVQSTICRQLICDFMKTQKQLKFKFL